MRKSLCLFFLGMCTLAAAQNVRQVFQNPPKAYRPMVRWWWPGGDVTCVELRREVRLLDEAGFGGAEIQPFVRLLNPHTPDALSPDLPHQVTERVYSYLTPAFFAHMRCPIEEARTRGMWLDFTFGSGWPFGGAGVITPELASVELRYTHLSIRGPVHFHEQILMPTLEPRVTNMKLPSGWAKRFKKREKLVAVVAVRGTDVDLYSNASTRVKRMGQLDPGTSVVLTNRLSPDGTFDWNVPRGTWQVFVFKELPTEQRVRFSAAEGPQFVLDHLNRQAFDGYAKRVGGRLRQYEGQFFDNGLRAIFCDSLEVSAYLFWSDNFLNEFRKRRGYDLTPFLPLLKVNGARPGENASSAHLPFYDIKGIGDHVRRDYWETVSDVMIDNFYLPFTQWAKANNLLSRVQAHGSPTDLLRVYGAASIPETEALYDDGRYDFLKMAAAGGDLYGRKVVSSESFVWAGKAYQVTPEMLKRYADELITAGVNEIIYHGYPYKYMDRSEPGWFPFSSGPLSLSFSSDLNQHNTFWPYLPLLNTYITRLQYLCQAGTTVVPVALYRGAIGYNSVPPPPPEPEIDTHLMTAGYNFDDINADALLKSKVDDGKLISPGGTHYNVLILQNQETVPNPVANQLIALAKSGLPIIFVGIIPVIESEVADGSLTRDHPYNGLQNILADRNVYQAATMAETVRILHTAVQPNIHFIGPSVPFIEKRVGTLDVFFLRNPDDAKKRLNADFTAIGAPEIWDPWTGAIQPATQCERHGKVVQIQFPIGPYGSKLLVFDPAVKSTIETAKVATPTQPVTYLAVGRNGWKFHGVGIGPGSQPETIQMEMPTLIDWTLEDSLKSFSGRGQYTTTFTVPSSIFDYHHRIILDLGDVKDVAEISIDGEAGPVLLLQPYRADVTHLVHVGRNTLQVTVVNALFNALAARGDTMHYSPKKINTANGLLPSGLIGPVRIEGTQLR